jgi:hypothetical protein
MLWFFIGIFRLDFEKIEDFGRILKKMKIESVMKKALAVFVGIRTHIKQDIQNQSDSSRLAR